MKTTKGRKTARVVRDRKTGMTARIPRDWVVVCIRGTEPLGNRGYQSGVDGVPAPCLETVFGLYTETEAVRAAYDLSIEMPGERVFVPMRKNGEVPR